VIGPIAVRCVDLDMPLAPINDVDSYPRTRVFVFDEGVLVGSTDIASARGPI